MLSPQHGVDGPIIPARAVNAKEDAMAFQSLVRGRLAVVAGIAAAVVAWPTAVATQDLPAPASIGYAGGRGPGQGKHLVLLAGDEEYRSEEALPMLAKIFSQR